jgi:hypothetical protein
MGNSSKTTQFLQKFSISISGILTFIAVIETANKEIVMAIIAFWQ